jgi:hypothetical protein
MKVAVVKVKLNGKEQSKFRGAVIMRMLEAKLKSLETWNY